MQLCSSSGVMLIGDAHLQKTVRCYYSCSWLRKAVGKVVTPRSKTYSHPSGSPGATEDNWQCRPLAWAASGPAAGTVCSVC